MVGRLGGTLSGSRAVPRDMSLKSTRITSALLGLGAVLANMSHTRAVVAFRALDAIAGHVSHASAGIAGLLRAESRAGSEAGAVGAVAG